MNINDGYTLESSSQGFISIQFVCFFNVPEFFQFLHVLQTSEYTEKPFAGCNLKQDNFFYTSDPDVT